MSGCTECIKIFDTVISKDASGRLTVIELPFNAKEVFSQPKGTIYVNGTINGVEYRGKLLSRGKGRFLFVLDKTLQKSIGYNGNTMTAHVTMSAEHLDMQQEDIRETVTSACHMDAITAIKTRQSIRRFAAGPVSEEILQTILYAGMCAPSAKNKRPFHFIVIRDKQLLSALGQSNSNAAMLESCALAIAICGDRNAEGMKEFLYADCAAAAQNMLLAIHSLGLGGVWCGVAASSDWRKLLIQKLALPPKLEPVTVLAVGWPDEPKAACSRWEPGKIHYEKW